MFFKKPVNFNFHVFLKAAGIMLADVLATGIAYFLGLWFRYDFSFQEMREVHLEHFLSAIGPWCLITVLVFLVFRLYSSIWAFVGTSEVFRIIGAFCVRIPVSFIMSRRVPVNLFHIGLATPASSLLQTVLCLMYYYYIHRSQRRMK